MLLEAYRDAHDGCCNVPRTWKDDPQLGSWVHNQKFQWRKYKVDPATSSMSTERVATLWLMGAIDSWRSPHWKSASHARERESSHGQKHYTLFEV